ncbi:hypothetical protein GCM10023238_39030 [Streptomyces heliomycini]
MAIADRDEWEGGSVLETRAPHVASMVSPGFAALAPVAGAPLVQRELQARRSRPPVGSRLRVYARWCGLPA